MTSRKGESTSVTSPRFADVGEVGDKERRDEAREGAQPRARRSAVATADAISSAAGTGPVSQTPGTEPGRPPGAHHSTSFQISGSIAPSPPMAEKIATADLSCSRASSWRPVARRRSPRFVDQRRLAVRVADGAGERERLARALERPTRAGPSGDRAGQVVDARNMAASARLRSRSRPASSSSPRPVARMPRTLCAWVNAGPSSAPATSACWARD